MNTALQAMLLQCDDRKLFLCPAWPADWDVSFRLHAPYRTTIEGSVTNGEVAYRVTPSDRAADVTVCLGSGNA